MAGSNGRGAGSWGDKGVTGPRPLSPSPGGVLLWGEQRAFQGTPLSPGSPGCCAAGRRVRAGAAPVPAYLSQARGGKLCQADSCGHGRGAVGSPSKLLRTGTGVLVVPAGRAVAPPAAPTRSRTTSCAHLVCVLPQGGGGVQGSGLILQLSATRHLLCVPLGGAITPHNQAQEERHLSAFARTAD